MEEGKEKNIRKEEEHIEDHLPSPMDTTPHQHQESHKELKEIEPEYEDPQTKKINFEDMINFGYTIAKAFEVVMTQQQVTALQESIQGLGSKAPQTPLHHARLSPIVEGIEEAAVDETVFEAEDDDKSSYRTMDDANPLQQLLEQYNPFLCTGWFYGSIDGISHFAGGNFTEASKIRKVANFLKTNALQWWTTMLNQGVVPSTWVQFKQIFAPAWITNTFEVDVMTAWNQLSAINCESLEEYNAKFWDALLPVSSFKIVPLAEQIEKYCCGLPKGIKKYCTKTSVMNMAQLMENAEVADDLIQGKPDEDGFRTRRKEPQGKQFSAKGNVTSRLTVPPFKKKPFAGNLLPFQDRDKDSKGISLAKTIEERKALRDARKCYICEEGHFANECPQRNSQNKDDKSDRKGKKPKPSARLVPDLVGARANFISPELASKLGIRAEEMGMTGEAGLACPGHSEAVTPILGKLRMHIQSYVDVEEFHIMPLQDCDVLLGIPWCYRLHAVVDTFHKKITLVHRGKTHFLDVKLKGESVPVVFASAISSVIKNHLSAYLVFAKEVHEVQSNLSKLDKDRAAFLNGFNDCFSDSLPDELPPERPEDHRIDVVPGSSPPNGPPYRVSAAQQKGKSGALRKSSRRPLVLYCFKKEETPAGEPVLGSMLLRVVSLYACDLVGFLAISVDSEIEVQKAAAETLWSCSVGLGSQWIKEMVSRLVYRFVSTALHSIKGVQRTSSTAHFGGITNSLDMSVMVPALEGIINFEELCRSVSIPEAIELEIGPHLVAFLVATLAALLEECEISKDRTGASRLSQLLRALGSSKYRQHIIYMMSSQLYEGMALAKWHSLSAFVSDEVLGLMEKVNVLVVLKGICVALESENAASDSHHKGLKNTGVGDVEACALRHIIENLLLPPSLVSAIPETRDKVLEESLSTLHIIFKK
ncbi:hypothetical protein L7F22_067612 [Adiantum nelumboides]|nr:hypothetical protein [Adiantum nelumboides]